MKKIMIKHTVEVDNNTYDRFLYKARLGDRECHKFFRDEFIAAGTAAVKNQLKEAIK
jgi:hypothetical protein